MIDWYDVFYLITGGFVLYSWYVLVAAFSENDEQSRNKIISSLVIYYVVANLVHFVAESQLLNILMTISILAALSYLMNFDRQKMVLSVVFSIFIIIGVDIVLALSTGYILESLLIHADHHSIFGRMMTILLIYIIGIGIKSMKGIGREIILPISYWITLVVFPIFSIFLSLILLIFSKYGSELVFAGIVMILILNIIVFSLYDRLMILYARRIEDLATEYLNNGYKKQVEVMTASIKNVNAIQHDISRHLISIETLVKNEKYCEIQTYIATIREQFSEDGMFAKTGNAIVDSIVNYELSISDIAPSAVSLEALDVPCELDISDYELTVVLSNIIRNAFQATEIVDEGVVDLYISYQKGILFIRIVNDYRKAAVGNVKEPFSKLEEENGHGFGLMNVNKVIMRNSGDMRVSSKDTKYIVEVMMYEGGES